MDERIHKTEVQIAEAVLRQRNVIALVTTYSVLVYVVWLLSFFFLVWPTVFQPVQDDADDRDEGGWPVDDDRHLFGGWWGVVRAVQKTAPVVLVPLGIYAVRLLLRTYYRRFIHTKGTFNTI